MVKINLLPLKVRKTKVEIQLYTYGVIAGSAAGILLIILLLTVMAQLRRTEALVRKAETTRAELAAKAGPLLGLDQQEQELARSFRLLQQLGRRQSEWIDLLDELAGRVPEDLWLSKLASSRPAGRSLALVLEGEAYHKIAVADFMQALEQSQRFREITLESLAESGQPGTASPVQFKLRAAYAQEAPAAGPQLARQPGGPR